jgi:hypothetical protein
LLTVYLFHFSAINGRVEIIIKILGEGIIKLNLKLLQIVFEYIVKFIVILYLMQVELLTSVFVETD